MPAKSAGLSSRLREGRCDTGWLRDRFLRELPSSVSECVEGCGEAGALHYQSVLVSRFGFLSDGGVSMFHLEPRLRMYDCSLGGWHQMLP